MKMTVFWDVAPCILVDWTQNNSELQLRHSMRRREMEMARRSNTAKSLRMCNMKTKNISSSFFLISTQLVAF
jgi:hypothetical protein